ncbi:MAG: glycosyltransferase, partial [Chryseobacterium sp.]
CVILESYACGKPVIATAVGGVPEFVKPGLGILIEKANENELYEAMENFATQKLQLKDEGSLRQFVTDHFSKESICRQFTDVYNDILTTASHS